MKTALLPPIIAYLGSIDLGYFCLTCSGSIWIGNTALGFGNDRDAVTFCRLTILSFFSKLQPAAAAG
eukprot:scaffold9738_cov38-Cyclotella_meneghiniana.AAC.5